MRSLDPLGDPFGGLQSQNNFHNNLNNISVFLHCVDLCTNDEKAAESYTAGTSAQKKTVAPSCTRNHSIFLLAGTRSCLYYFFECT